MLRRRVKSDIAQIRRKTWKNNFEGLNCTIQVHVKDGIVIVPHSGVWACYLVSDKAYTIVSRIRLNLLYRCACSYPSLDSRFHSDGRTDSRKIKECRAAGD